MTPTPVFDVCGDLPTGTVLLEASAGTGKTWTIAALVARFVAEGQARLAEMLVVTFGRAASQELRERVRARLVEAEHAVDRAVTGGGVQRDDELLELLTDVPDEERVLRRNRLRDALVDFDAATIATTHQFCQLVLRGLGIAGDTDRGARLVEDLDELLIEVVDDLYVRGFARQEDVPVFDRRTALAIARAAVGDPQARLEPRQADPASPAARRLRFAEAVRAEMEVRKRRLGVLSHDDLLSRLADALQDAQAPARQRMRDRWRVVLVDEFQDTDPVQWAVLDRAFSGHATMVLIGDPKQAIYAFRGGDVATYLLAEDTATDKATLAVNHRSDAPLLASVQTVLRGAALGDDRILVRDVAAQWPDRRLTGTPVTAPFRLRLLSRGSARKGLPINAARRAVGADLAADVTALLVERPTFEGRPLRPSDIAVLCETRKQCQAAYDGLSAAGVQAVIAGGGSVFTTRGADEWLTLIEALEQPHRSSRVRSAALTSFVGLGADALDAGGDALTERLADQLREWAGLLRTRGVSAVFEVACAAGLPERVLGHRGGERLMTDLRHVAESLHDVAVRDGLGLVALLGWLREHVALDRAEVAGERTRRLDSDAAAVQILTIHGSKGLEYPVVYLPFLCDLWPRRPEFPLFHDDDGVRCRDVAGPEADPDDVARAEAEEAGENLRLLYVAMTRAQSQLVTWWFANASNTSTSPLHRMLLGRAPGQPEVERAPTVPDDEEALRRLRLWEAAGGPVVEQVEERAEVDPLPAPDLVELRARTWTRTVDQAWRRTSYTALSSAAAEPVLTLGSEPEVVPKQDEPQLMAMSREEVPPSSAVPSPMAGLPTGAAFGSLVHAVLEHADPAAPERGGDLHAELLHHVRAQLVRWPVPLDADELAAALGRVLDSPLGPVGGDTTLRMLGRADRMAELDFELPLAGGDGNRGSRGEPSRLSGLAPLLQAHLPPGDPLLPYADVLGDAGHRAQELHGYLTGSLDAVLRVAGHRYVVVDYKTNWLGGGGHDAALTAWHYRPDALDAAMQHSTYPLQALLYAVVLHRFLRWRLPDYEPGRHLGGVLYLYVRGMCGPATPVVDGRPCGVFAWQPPAALVEAVSDLLDGAAAEEVA